MYLKNRKKNRYTSDIGKTRKRREVNLANSSQTNDSTKNNNESLKLDNSNILSDTKEIFAQERFSQDENGILQLWRPNFCPEYLNAFGYRNPFFNQATKNMFWDWCKQPRRPISIHKPIYKKRTFHLVHKVRLNESNLIENIKGISPQACINRCNINTNCVGTSYQINKINCHLFSENHSQSYDSNWFSIIGSQENIFVKKRLVNHLSNRPDVNSVEKCWSMCKNTTSCIGVTFYYTDENVCGLYSNSSSYTEVDSYNWLSYISSDEFTKMSNKWNKTAHFIVNDTKLPSNQYNELSNSSIKTEIDCWNQCANDLECAAANFKSNDSCLLYNDDPNKIRTSVVAGWSAYIKSDSKISENWMNIDCQLSEWSDWSGCSNKIAKTSRSMDEKTESRTRDILVKPKYGGMKCGDLEEQRSCF